MKRIHFDKQIRTKTPQQGLPIFYHKLAVKAVEMVSLKQKTTLYKRTCLWNNIVLLKM